MAREVTGGAQWSDTAPAAARLGRLELVEVATGVYELQEGASADAFFAESSAGVYEIDGAATGPDARPWKLASGNSILAAV